jgi:hypothetical protein
MHKAPADWSKIYASLCRKFLVKDDYSSVMSVIAFAKKNRDGWMVLFGEDAQWWFLHLAQWPLFRRISDTFCVAYCWPNGPAEFPWVAAGLLPSAPGISEQDRDYMVSCARKLVSELMR